MKDRGGHDCSTPRVVRDAAPGCPWSSAEDAFPEFEERTGKTEARAFLEEELRKIEADRPRRGSGREASTKTAGSSRASWQGRPQRGVEAAVRHAHDLHCGDARPRVGADQLVGAGRGLMPASSRRQAQCEQREGKLGGEVAGLRSLALEPADGGLRDREQVESAVRSCSSAARVRSLPSAATSPRCAPRGSHRPGRWRSSGARSRHWRRRGASFSASIRSLAASSALARMAALRSSASSAAISFAGRLERRPEALHLRETGRQVRRCRLRRGPSRALRCAASGAPPRSRAWCAPARRRRPLRGPHRAVPQCCGVGRQRAPGGGRLAPRASTSALTPVFRGARRAAHVHQLGRIRFGPDRAPHVRVGVHAVDRRAQEDAQGEAVEVGEPPGGARAELGRCLKLAGAQREGAIAHRHEHHHVAVGVAFEVDPGAGAGRSRRARRRGSLRHAPGRWRPPVILQGRTAGGRRPGRSLPAAAAPGGSTRKCWPPQGSPRRPALRRAASGLHQLLIMRGEVLLDRVGGVRQGAAAGVCGRGRARIRPRSTAMRPSATASSEGSARRSPPESSARARGWRARRSRPGVAAAAAAASGAARRPRPIPTSGNPRGGEVLGKASATPSTTWVWVSARACRPRGETRGSGPSIEGRVIRLAVEQIRPARCSRVTGTRPEGAIAIPGETGRWPECRFGSRPRTMPARRRPGRVSSRRSSR